MEKENPELSTQTGEKRLVIQLSGDTAPSMMAKQGVYRSWLVPTSRSRTYNFGRLTDL